MTSQTHKTVPVTDYWRDDPAHNEGRERELLRAERTVAMDRLRERHPVRVRAAAALHKDLSQKGE